MPVLGNRSRRRGRAQCILEDSWEETGCEPSLKGWLCFEKSEGRTFRFKVLTSWWGANECIVFMGRWRNTGSGTGCPHSLLLTPQKEGSSRWQLWSTGNVFLGCCAENRIKATVLSKEECCHWLVMSAIRTGGERNDMFQEYVTLS